MMIWFLPLVNILLIMVIIGLMMDNNKNLVGGFNLPLLKNMSSSVGMMKFPIMST